MEATNLVAIQSQLTELTSRAKRINYKNTIPRLPKNPTESTLAGFKLRLSNWIKQLEVLEKERLTENVIQTGDVLTSYLSR